MLLLFFASCSLCWVCYFILLCDCDVYKNYLWYDDIPVVNFCLFLLLYFYFFHKFFFVHRRFNGGKKTYTKNEFDGTVCVAFLLFKWSTYGPKFASCNISIPDYVTSNETNKNAFPAKTFIGEIGSFLMMKWNFRCLEISRSVYRVEKVSCESVWISRFSFYAIDLPLIGFISQSISGSKKKREEEKFQ